jgi:hypothetical protein
MTDKSNLKIAALTAAIELTKIKSGMLDMDKLLDLFEKSYRSILNLLKED